MNDVDENIVCDICLDDTCTEDDRDGTLTDALVMCDTCNVAVH